MGQRKRSRISVVEEEEVEQQRSPTSTSVTEKPKPSHAREESTTAASGERLRAAAQAGRLDELEGVLGTLKQGDLALNLADWGGWTALMHAASGDKPELVERLLKKGASVDATDVRDRCCHALPASTALAFAFASSPD